MMITVGFLVLCTWLNLWAVYHVQGLLGEILRLTNEFKAGLDRLQ